MYRQFVRSRILARDVVGFLLCDAQFPRSMANCLDEIATSMGRLPRHELPLATVLRLKAALDERRDAWRDDATLHRLLDELQSDMAGVHDQILATWFLPDAA
jgi:uncharacterized alpha-E superfamily protein